MCNNMSKFSIFLILLCSIITLTAIAFMCFKIFSKVGDNTITVKNTTDIDETLQIQLDGLDQKIQYKLFTRELKDPLVLTYDNWNTTKENFKFDKEAKFVTHGWLSSGETDFAQSVKDAYLAKEDLNVIIVDWSSVASNIWYPVPMLYTKSIGRHYGKFMKFLIGTGLNLDKVHLIGHSLGAHVSGFCGREILTGKPKRLTALDPALPGFPSKLTPADHITHTDAHFVDVIHTCGGTAGVLFPVGHVDFYPNSGVAPQPGCAQIGKKSLSCSHSRSWMYFVESISREQKFVAKKCKSWFQYMGSSCEEGKDILMGDPCPSTAEGTYFLKTNSAPPFANGK